MKKIVTLLLGAWFFFTGVQDLLIGETIGFGTLAGVGGDITIEENPIEFVLQIIFMLGMGLWLIKIGLSEKSID